MTADASVSKRQFSVEHVRADFPILHQEVNGHPLVYLDNAATTQKPQVVIDALVDYYTSYNSNVHRGAHSLSDKATAAFEHARNRVAEFIGSPKPAQIIWTRGVTESINLVANTWGRANLRSGQRILVPEFEHHSNIVPWQLLAEKVGAEVVPIPIDDEGEIEIEAYTELLDERVALVAITQVSNALGTVNPVEQMIAQAHSVGAKVLVDGAQAISHFGVDLQILDCDFYTFSAHKIFGPTGIGVLWGKEELLEAMPPWHGGGEMIETVSFDGTTYAGLPHKFEAGTPDIAGAIGLAAALDYVDQFDRADLLQHEQALLSYCIEKCAEIDGLTRIGQAKNSVSVFSFLVEGSHPSDLGTLLDQQGIAVRTGHHCTQPLMQRYGIPGTARASFSIYNKVDDIDRLATALEKIMSFLR